MALAVGLASSPVNESVNGCDGTVQVYASPNAGVSGMTPLLAALLRSSQRYTESTRRDGTTYLEAVEVFLHV